MFCLIYTIVYSCYVEVKNQIQTLSQNLCYDLHLDIDNEKKSSGSEE